MRFSSVIAPLFAICSALGVAFASPVLDARQEAARFGGVYATPSTVKPGQLFNITYNSTKAYWQPKTLDIYIQGTYPNNFVTPYVQLLRSDYGNETHVYSFETTLPVLDASDSSEGYLADAGYSLWAFITYATGTNATYVGGVSGNIAIDLS